MPQGLASLKYNILMELPSSSEPGPTADLPNRQFGHDDRLQGRNIRLIQLRPGEEDDNRQCDLIEKPLDQDVKYTALSSCKVT